MDARIQLKSIDGVNITDEINEEVSNNIMKTDKMELIKQYVISAIHCRISDVTNIEGVINVQHLGGETQLVFGKKSPSVIDDSIKFSEENQSDVATRANVNDDKDYSDSDSVILQRFSPYRESEDDNKEEMPLIIDTDNCEEIKLAPSPSDTNKSEELEMPLAIDMTATNFENNDKIPEDKRTFADRLDETLNRVVASYVVESPPPHQERITDHFPIQKNRFTIRYDIKEKLRKPKFSKLAAKRFLCNQCNEEFTALEVLCQHTLNVHKTYRCMECNQTFTQRSNLQRHSLKHIGFKPFVCAVCEKGYYRKDHLVRHIELTHPGRDPKRTTKALISSARCLAFIAFCRKEGINPSKCTKLEYFNDFSPYQSRSDDKEVRHQFELLTAVDSANVTDDSDKNEDRIEQENDNMEGDMEIDETEQEIPEEQYYEDENGELVLIVKPEPVPWV